MPVEANLQKILIRHINFDIQNRSATSSLENSKIYHEIRDRAYGNNLYVLFFAFLKKVIKKLLTFCYWEVNAGR